MLEYTEELKERRLKVAHELANHDNFFQAEEEYGKIADANLITEC